MLKIRIIPILTFNGIGLVKTKKFQNPRMIGNPVQAARVYNSRGVDELVFLDIIASKQKRKPNLKLIEDVIKQCYMPVAIGGGIETIDDINNLLKIGADKVVVKSKAILDKNFMIEAIKFFGSQCITVSIDAIKLNNSYKIFNEFGLDINIESFVKEMEDLGVGEFILNSVDNDGMMSGFNIELVNNVEQYTNTPIVVVGGAGNMGHYIDLFNKTKTNSVGSSSIFHFTQHTPLDIKTELKNINLPIRI
jgi:cyclase